MKIIYVVLITSFSILSMHRSPLLSNLQTSDNTDDESSASETDKMLKQKNPLISVLEKDLENGESSTSENTTDENISESSDKNSYQATIESYKKYLEKLHEPEFRKTPSRNFFNKLQQFKKHPEFKNYWSDERLTLSSMIKANVITATFAMQSKAAQEKVPLMGDIYDYSAGFEECKKYLSIALENRKRLRHFNLDLHK